MFDFNLLSFIVSIASSILSVISFFFVIKVYKIMSISNSNVSKNSIVNKGNNNNSVIGNLNDRK